MRRVVPLRERSATHGYRWPVRLSPDARLPVTLQSGLLDHETFRAVRHDTRFLESLTQTAPAG